MRTSDFDFYLPDDLIAARPAEHREDARLLVLNRADQTWQHKRVADLPDFVRPNDLWIFNDSRVFKARLVTSNREIELLLLEETSPQHWLTLSFPAKKTAPGATLDFGNADGAGTSLTGEVIKTLPSGERVIRFHRAFDCDAFGEVPLPPYIRKAREKGKIEIPESLDTERYQTVYARETGSVAAPTAGLHFTPEMLERIPHAFVTLHVGIGTFRPVKANDPRDHPMHPERFVIPSETAAAATAAQRRVCVGTTSVRVLETVDQLEQASGRTTHFILPPYRFKHVDALVTNFHLPRSTLLMLVAAFLENGPEEIRKRPRFKSGLEFLKAAYAEAVRSRYHFFSYGDAMLIE